VTPLSHILFGHFAMNPIALCHFPILTRAKGTVADQFARIRPGW
jgi:hypothetical protein